MGKALHEEKSTINKNKKVKDLEKEEIQKELVKMDEKSLLLVQS